ncbi:UDP-N-acetylglucosamine 2-epimerase [Thiomicrorhabdus xiamenensis]|uniref:UDP-N-acetylglucosamine 2-epimerase (Hydrolyzing) n=1 Tax=Thiomicrorhabdus xiamenensis TaxID=2739063 RepID=A0A7D4NQW1_9GAMM|nr:UDP-N-acetylglucosamine 2-epimerase [Thiomicrorhabdus xiamenensis]QKI89571.1 UDP-N-acetylglucosamine 2-epimerase (hydrolyzing) [Thiomicrorhabdus xiamenensis]
MSRKRIALLTTSRADYGLLKPLWLELQKTDFDPFMIATGAHLMPSQGRTLQQIEDDRVEPLETVDLEVSGDSETDLCRAMGTGMVKFSLLFEKLKPDLLVVLGDRFELLPACNSALIHKIPIAHLHGGEATFGLIDEAIRHSVTKMASLHFVAHEAYRRRVLQMGESPDRVWNVGAIGLDNFRRFSAWSRQELEQKTGLDFSQPVLLVTFHPVTLDSYEEAEAQADEVVSALEELPYQVLATLPNADTGGQQIEKRLLSAIERYPQRFKLVSSLGMKGYMSAMQHSAAMVGNSSSGILEAASFRLPVVNIGDRQAGRIQAENVLQVDCEREKIQAAVQTALSEGFLSCLRAMENPYGKGRAAEKIVAQLLQVNLNDKSRLLKKRFYDLPESCFKE